MPAGIEKEPVEDVARPVHLAALDRRILSEGPADRPLQRPMADQWLIEKNGHLSPHARGRQHELAAMPMAA